MKNFILCFYAFITLIACNTAPKLDIQGEKNAILGNEDQWTLAIQTKDTEKIAGFYANDAVRMSQNQPVYIGLNAIRTSIGTMLADTTIILGSYKGNVDFIDVSASGDLAYAYGHDEIMVKTKDGLVKDEGKWVDVWKKSDGQWKVVVSSSNSNKPLAGQ